MRGLRSGDGGRWIGFSNEAGNSASKRFPRGRQEPRVPLDFTSIPPSPVVIQCGNVEVVSGTYCDLDCVCCCSVYDASGKSGELVCLWGEYSSFVNRFSDWAEANPIVIRLTSWIRPSTTIMVAMVSRVIGFLLVLCSDQKRVISC